MLDMNPKNGPMPEEKMAIECWLRCSPMSPSLLHCRCRWCLIQSLQTSFEVHWVQNETGCFKSWPERALPAVFLYHWENMCNFIHTKILTLVVKLSTPKYPNPFTYNIWVYEFMSLFQRLRVLQCYINEYDALHAANKSSFWVQQYLKCCNIVSRCSCGATLTMIRLVVLPGLFENAKGE